MTHQTNPAYGTALALLNALGVKFEHECGIAEVHLKIVGSEFPTLTIVREFWKPDSLDQFQRVVEEYAVKLTPKEVAC